ncbi:hypothetical protein E1301_Tti019439 [Triplophysa tibetana]|uniref:Uncharacterized protein n=1 Tax=Triplophysa tibetana TaxID=1572043 RepID=A0A5A9PIG1_9TELE|nr:hypothetical protein E1301_Tti019439 [Triplophysa tibetana]
MLVTIENGAVALFNPGEHRISSLHLPLVSFLPLFFFLLVFVKRITEGCWLEHGVVSLVDILRWCCMYTVCCALCVCVCVCVCECLCVSVCV